MEDLQIHQTVLALQSRKHWVDNVNSCCHDPIGLEEVWQTKWWPTRQFTSIHSVAEVNAVQSWAQAWHKATTLQLEFCQALAKQMFNNLIYVPVKPDLPPMCTRRQRNIKHVLLKHGLWQGSWNPYTHQSWEVNTDYLHLQCSDCSQLMWHYC